MHRDKGGRGAAGLGAGRALGAAALLAPSIAVTMPRMLAVLFAAAAIFGLALALIERRRLSIQPPFAALLAALALWAMASSFWAPNPSAALGGAALLALSLAAGAILMAIAGSLEEKERREIARLGAIGFAVGAALFAFESFSGALVGRLVWALGPDTVPMPDRIPGIAVTAFVLLVWPALAYLVTRDKIPAAAAIVLAGAAVLSQSRSTTLMLAAVIGAVALIPAWRFDRALPPVMAATALLFVMLAPILLGFGLEIGFTATDVDSDIISANHRLKVWAFAIDRIAERPLTGWGFDAARRFPGGEVQFMPAAALIPLHTHNAALQWWLELGFPGALLCAAIVAMALLGITRLHGRITRAGAVAAAVAALTIGFLSYGAWQHWWLATLWLAAAMVAALPAGADAPARTKA